MWWQNIDDTRDQFGKDLLANSVLLRAAAPSGGRRWSWAENGKLVWLPIAPPPPPAPPRGAGPPGIISSSKSDLQFIIFGFNNSAPFLTFQDQNWFPHKFISHLRSDKISVSWETSVILNILNVKLSGFLRKYFCHSKTITVAMLKLVGRKYGDVVLTFSGKSAGWCYFQRAPWSVYKVMGSWWNFGGTTRINETIVLLLLWQSLEFSPLQRARGPGKPELQLQVKEKQQLRIKLLILPGLHEERKSSSVRQLSVIDMRNL